MFIENCGLCGYPAEIIDDRGIGDIRCSNCSCENYNSKSYVNGVGYPRYHFSGKYNTSKKEAIRKWNHEQSIGLMIPQ